MSLMPIMGGFTAGLPMSDSAFLTEEEADTVSTTHTYSSVSLGTESVNRKIIVACAAYLASHSSVTVDGSSATKRITGAQTGAYGHHSIWEVDLPTGASGDIVVVHSGTVTDAGIGVWAIYSTASTFHASDQDSVVHATGTDVTTTATVPANGIMISCCTMTNIVVTAAWTGLTERWDGGMGAHQWTGASDYYASEQTSKVISVAETANTQSYRQLLTLTYGAS